MKRCVMLLAGVLAFGGFGAEKYLVVNLAERNSARAVTYLEDVPEGGWTDADRTTNLVFRLCEPGTFRMGRSPDEEPTDFNSLPREVTLTKPFWFSVFQVTQWQYENLMRRNPSTVSRADCRATRPVDNVSWHDAKACAKALGDRLRRGGFDLPTSAQWEYAARAGETSRRYGSDPLKIGRFDDNADKSARKGGWWTPGYLAKATAADATARVGSYEPNAWGIYDVLGNGLEWCRDAERDFGSADGRPETDPNYENFVYTSRRARILRGTMWWQPSSAASLSWGLCDREKEKTSSFTLRLVWNPEEDAAAAPAAKVSRELAATDGSLAFGFTLRDGAAASLDLAFAATNAKPVRISVTPKAQQLANQWTAYRYRARHGLMGLEITPVPDAKVVFSAARQPWFNFQYDLLPYFDNEHWDGVYDYEYAIRNFASWRRAYTPLREKEFRVEIRSAASADRLDAYVDGQFAGSATNLGGLVSAKLTGPAATADSLRALPPAPTGLGETDRFRPLDPQPNELRVNDALRAGATLSLGAGRREIGGVPFDVWKPEESFDQGRHRETCRHDDIMYWGMLNVSGFRNGPEFLQYTLPKRPWSAAWVLCCPIPNETGPFGEHQGEPVTGVEFGVYGSTRGKLAVTTTDLAITHESASRAAFFTNGTARVVGSLTYEGPTGERHEAPVWLVRQRLDYGHVFAYAKDSFGLGFVGGGTWDGSPRSNVQVLGCTLEVSPVDFAVEETVRGNIFADDDRAETSVRLTATRPDVKGRLEWTVRDPNFRELKRGAFDWSFAKAGEERKFTLDLSEWREGWYALDWRVVDADGVEQIAHEAAFTQLGRDTREAGFESPYAAWPQLGRHETNPNRAEQLAMLHKAGFHKGWHEAVTNEWEYPDYRYTFTEYCAKLDGLGRASEKTTPEEFEKMFAKDVEGYRALKAKFPHLNTISIFHENEPRHVSHELRGEFLPEERGDFGEPDYAARNRNRTRYLEAFCRHMHKTFPGVRLRLANNSAASERVAQIARAGFDLNLVDELGSEVLAFRAMPELAADQAAPGTMWALRETGRHFGMTNVQIGASSEFVFRPERRVNREDPDHLRQTAYAVRDYLVSLGHGCPYVSSGHLEDCFSPYYDSDWGASGQCRPYPLSYPKRIYTAIATLTKVLDRPVFRRRVPTGDSTAYAFEFARDRRTKDFAYALWTPAFDVEMTLAFPEPTELTLVDAFGGTQREKGRRIVLTVGALPRYVIAATPVSGVTTRLLPCASAPALRPKAEPGKPAPKRPKGGWARVLVDSSTDVNWRTVRPVREWLPSVEFAVPGVFENAVVEDPVHGQVLECRVATNGADCAKIFSEFQFLKFRKPLFVDGREGGLGIWVRGNGGFGRVGFVLQKFKGDTYRGDTKVLWAGNRGFVDFRGWQYLRAPFAQANANVSLAGYRLVGVIAGSGRYALDPLEMRPVEGPLALGEIYEDPSAKRVRNPDDDWVTERQETRLPGWF